jgi:hypothetical protein
MPRERFVRPETITIPLADGDWIVVKKRLNVGELRDAEFHALMIHSRTNEDGNVEDRWIINPRNIGLAQTAAFLVDWSFPNPIRQLPLDEVLNTLRALDPESLAEIKIAIDNHETRQWELRAAEKKTTTGEPPSSPISSSPVAMDGSSSGSATSTPTSTPSLSRV